ncbi:MAG: 3'(2'),5'-bisphosphate nucleotidase CysQ family protein [Planctomycetota bacterium]|jgi:3'(2'), 5'-bisphosphate nucleotidase
MELRQAAETARDLVREAAELAARLQGSVTARDKGGGRGPVTEADLAVEALLLAGLQSAFPNTPVLSEETRQQVDLPASDLWCVDPIDGTREYAKGLAEYAIQVGLIREGVPAAGALALPGIGAVYWGWQGGGCYLDGDPVRLERFEDLSAATLIHSRFHRGSKLDRAVERLGVEDRIAAGGVGYKAAQVLLGRAHLYLHAGGGTTWWDTVAPAALILAAGGVVANASGAPLRYADDLGHRQGLLFAAPGVGEHAAARLAEE